MPVETEKIDRTLQEVINQFGGVTFHPEHLLGVWLHENQRFEEYNVRLVVDVEDTPENAAFFRRLKQALKARFRQVEIWIVSYEIQIT